MRFLPLFLFVLFLTGYMITGSALPLQGGGLKPDEDTVEYGEGKSEAAEWNDTVEGEEWESLSELGGGWGQPSCGGPIFPPNGPCAAPFTECSVSIESFIEMALHEMQEQGLIDTEKNVEGARKWFRCNPDSPFNVDCTGCNCL